MLDISNFLQALGLSLLLFNYFLYVYFSQAYQERKIEKPPFVPDLEDKPSGIEDKPAIPEELQCSICQDLLCDAVLIPCCGSCFCDECVRQALLDSDHHECPVCHELDQTPDKLIPNRFLRNKVRPYLVFDTVDPYLPLY